MKVMDIDPSSMIQNMDALSFQASGDISNNASPNIGDTFKDYFNKAVQGVNNEQLDSTQLQRKYTMEDPNVSLSKVMIQMQKAQISLSALVTVRNKIIDGYKMIMNESV